MHRACRRGTDCVMLILAEGTIHRPVQGEERTAVEAWLGPMVDDGFLVHGYLEISGNRIWMILSSPDYDSARMRLADLPAVHDGSCTFTTTAVSGLRFH